MRRLVAPPEFFLGRHVIDRDAVLILTHSGDHYTVDLVQEELARRGARALRFDTDRFPAETVLHAALPAPPGKHVVRLGGTELDLARVRSVWARRRWPAKLDESLDPRFRESCGRESAAALDGFLDALGDVPWINTPQATIAAENKLRQLRLASEVGLDVPATLVTNDPERARAFFDERGGAVVVKLLRALTSSMEPAPSSVRTSELCAEDLEHLEGLRHAPMVFQERIEKECELRVACVGSRQLAARIDASGSAAGRVDWRGATPKEARWEVAELAAEDGRRLDHLRRRMELSYGAVDLVRTPEGRTVFLEINSGGEWGMLQRDAGLDVAGALVDELLGGPE